MRPPLAIPFFFSFFPTTSATLGYLRLKALPRLGTILLPDVRLGRPHRIVGVDETSAEVGVAALRPKCPSGAFLIPSN
jgi:hypothetical protein